MMSPLFSLAMDFLIVALLIATILFAWRLNSRLKKLRENRDELAATVAAFNEATQRAETSIGQLKKAANEATEQLQAAINKARGSQDELVIMLDTAESLAKRLEQSSMQASAHLREQQNLHESRHDARYDSRPDPRYDLRQPAMPPAMPSVAMQQAPIPPVPPLTAQPLTAQPMTAQAAGNSGKPRSKSEQELLQAIEKMR